MFAHSLLVAVVAAMAAVGEGNQQKFSTLSIHRPSSHAKNAALFTQKIIGGGKADITQRPYVANIALWSPSQKSYQRHCGGSILDKYHILSAAHCFSNRNAKQYRIRVGSVNWKNGGQVAYGAKVLVHAKFKEGKSLDYDVAVLRTDKPLAINGKTVKPTSLVKVNTAVKADKPITLMGWGYTDPLLSDPLPDNLLEVKVSTIDHAECEDDYSIGAQPVTKRMFCGMDLTGDRKDSCKGDSGGPVIDTNTNQQLGIVSWSDGCAQLASPSVYTDLANAEIRSFIDEAMRH